MEAYKNHDRPHLAKPPLKKNDGWALTAQENADVFAEHLAKVFCPNDVCHIESEKEVDKILNQDL